YTNTQERQEDQEDAPCRLAPSGDVVPAEHVGQDPEQDQEPREPQEEDEHGPEHVHEGVISCDCHGTSLSPTRVIGNHPPGVTPGALWLELGAQAASMRHPGRMSGRPSLS